MTNGNDVIWLAAVSYYPCKKWYRNPVQVWNDLDIHFIPLQSLVVYTKMKWTLESTADT